jgi:hypothetical protein
MHATDLRRRHLVWDGPRVLRRAQEVADAKGYRVIVRPDGAVELLTPLGSVLDQAQINALNREIEREQSAAERVA